MAATTRCRPSSTTAASAPLQLVRAEALDAAGAGARARPTAWSPRRLRGWLPGTSSSSAAATTRWSPPATWPAPGSTSRWSSATPCSAARSHRRALARATPSTAGSSAHIMVRHTGIVEDLRLDECGLTYLDMDPWGFAPFGDPATGEQQALTFHVDLDRTCDVDRGAVRRPRRRGLPRLRHRLGRPQRGGVRGVPGRAAPPAGWAGTCGAPARRPASAGWRCRGSSCSRPTSCSTSTSPTSGSRPRWPGSARSPGPPTHEVATADLVGWNALLHSRPPGRAVGGSGALTAALAERLRRLGGTRARSATAPRASPAPATGSPASPPTPASTSRPAPSSPAATC